MSYSIDWNGTGFTISLSGAVSLEEVFEATGKLHGHEYYQNQKYQLWNYLDATFDNNYEQGGIEESAAIDWVALKTTHRIKGASVIKDDAIIALYNEYIETAKKLGTNCEFKLFESYDIALLWCKS